MGGIIDILSSADLSRKGELSRIRIDGDFTLIRNKTVIRFKTSEDFFRFEWGFLHSPEDSSLSKLSQERFIQDYYKNTTAFVNDALNETWLFISEGIKEKINEYVNLLDD